VPLGKDLLCSLGEHLRERASTCSVAWASTPWARQRTALVWRGMEAPWGMAAAACQSGLAGAERCASEVVARGRLTAGGGRQADRSK
jgi:hypothetical protein